MAHRPRLDPRFRLHVYRRSSYSEAIISANDPQDRGIQELIYHYIQRNLAPDPKTGRRRRAMMLLLKGEDAVRKTRSVVGNISAERRGGETIRDTYGDLIIDDENEVRYFEPAVLAAPTFDEAESKLKLWAQYSDSDGGIVENVIAYQPGEAPQRPHLGARAASTRGVFVMKRKPPASHLFITSVTWPRRHEA